MDENQEESFENGVYKFPTGELAARYQVSRGLVYKRLGALNIKSVKESKNSYITTDQLQLMDGLHTHLEAGGKTDEFVQQRVATGEIVLAQEAVNESAALVTQARSQGMAVSETQNLAETGESVAPRDEQTSEGLPLGTVAPHIGDSDEEYNKMDTHAQFLAASRYIATQDLADHYARTGSFTIPEVIQRVKERRTQTQQYWEQAHRSADPNTLSQLLIQRAKQKAAGSLKRAGGATPEINPEA